VSRLSIFLLVHSILFATSASATGGGCSSIAEIACSTDGFATLCAAVQAAGLDAALGGDDTFTVFAPTDDAFGNLPSGTVEALLDDIPSLTNVLLFHAVAGKEVYAKDLECQETVEMANGEDSRTVCSSGDIFQKGGGNSRNQMPRIVTTDIEACNGVIHVVDEVMLPKTIFVGSEDEEEEEEEDKPDNCSTIADIACNTDGFATLCAAVKAAGLAETLSGGTFTVFAPTDNAFGNLPDGTVEALLDDIPSLTDILLFHAVAGEVYSSDLHCQGKVEMANGKDSRTVCKGGKIYQKGSGNSNNARPEIVTADLKACNGVVHVVSEVLLP